ncbi:molybdenum cofactor guanylyltransferase [Phormidium sp. CLA17]|uniref:molybdenum cofactor guanylyltransferase n=1 Tax=Leptolyngbya sp. Cla-17 TaxID=2803751 RepID=UPI0014918F0C|nr:molybdenum cofactor guanylyltransferase [Leptolyngbya sp. Cla-17]MBM0743856.1 molybdenum cofactor guanylyltransferase [Leptolyngbya sp. Cla-17]
MQPSLSVIILAGGQSSRMGRDKALIRVDGTPMLQRTCEIAMQCAPQVFVVTTGVRPYSGIVPARCSVIEESPLKGESKPQGPLVGFVQGLTQTQAEWVLLLACDLPRLSQAVLQRWMLQLMQVNGAMALLPKSQKGWEPLCGFYRTDCLPSLTQFMNQGGRSLQAWLAQASVQAIQFSDDPNIKRQEQAMLFNCNTPEDLLQVRGVLDML